jgi:prephenate dehydratase
MFFVDLEGGAADPRVAEALGALHDQVEELRVLGSYTNASGVPG